LLLKIVYGILAIIDFVAMTFISFTMSVSFATNQLIVSALVLIVSIYLLYLIVFLKKLFK